MSTLISAQNISHNYGTKKALDDVSFSLKQGQFTALLGPNGAGKTTLFSLLSQFIIPSSGKLEFYSSEANSKLKPLTGRQALSNIGFVFQQPTLDLDLSVAQNLYYHAALHGISKSQAKQRIESELDRLNMLERLNEKVRSLNGGHKRRVEIARALLHKPSILLLDEPTVGLDIETRDVLKQHVHNLCKEQGIATLWTTHLIDEINDDDHVIMLHQGKVRLQGTCSELMSDNQADDLRGLFINTADLNQS